jgi:hypothetical protein
VADGQRNHVIWEAMMREGTRGPGREASPTRVTAPPLSTSTRLSIFTCRFAPTSYAAHDQRSSSDMADH